MKFLKKNSLLTLLIILVSLIYGLGHFVAHQSSCDKLDLLCKTQFSRITRDEIFAYAPEVNYILNGNFPIKELYTQEYSNYPSPFLGETAPATLFAIISKLSGSIEKSLVIGDFIFPPIIFLLLYFFIRLFIKNKLFSLSVAALVVTMRDLIAVIPYPIATFDYLLKPDDQLFSLIFSRSFHPQLTFIFFLGATLSLFKLAKKSSNLLLLATGILYTILFYSYVFYWTYFTVFLIITSIYFFLKGNIRKVFQITKAALIGIMLGSFYFYNMFKFHQLNLSLDFIERTALDQQPIPLTILRYLLIVVLFFFAFKNKGREYLLLTFFLLAGLLAPIISNLILGANLETPHYLRRAMMPFATIASFLVLFKIFENKNRLLKFLSLAIIASSLFFAIKAQTQSKEETISDYQIESSERHVYSWLQKNTNSNDVVGSVNVAFNLGLATYTGNKTYLPRMDRTIIPSDEGVDRYIILSNLLGISKLDQKKFLNEEIMLSYLFAYQAYSKELSLDLDSPKSQQARNKIESFTEGSLGELSNEFRLDYLVVTPKEFSVIEPNIGLIQPVTSINEYVIFKKR